MTIAAELPDDIEELKRLLLAGRAELAAAKAGLVTKTLEIEKLKIQIARLRRMSFGASSERVRRELEQLELKLEELETAQAEADAAAETAPAMAEEPAREQAPAKKQRRRCRAGRSCTNRAAPAAYAAARCAKWARTSPRFWITSRAFRGDPDVRPYLRKCEA